MVDISNLRGGPDNITVIVARVKAGEMVAASHGPLEPLRISPQSPPDLPKKSGAHPILWVLTALLAIGAGVLAILGMMLPALGAGVGALLFLAIALSQQLGGAPAIGAPLHRGVMLGKGPHTHTVCKPNEKIVNVLAELVEQLREAAASGKFTVDWARFDTYCKRSAAAATRKEYPQAVAEYSRALRFMMSELRNQAAKRPKPSDSDVNL